MTQLAELIQAYEAQIAQYESDIKETQSKTLRTTDQKGRRTLQDHIHQQKELMRQLQRVVGDLTEMTAS